LLEISEERQLACHQNEENHPKSPDVSSLSVVLLLPRYVGIHVVRCAAKETQLLLRRGLDGEAEVYDLDPVAIGRVDEDVVQLEISVHNVSFVQVGDSGDHLSEYRPALLLGQPHLVLLLDVVVERLAIAELHDEVDVHPRVNDLKQAHHVRVV